MRQSAQSECKLIRVLALRQQLTNEVSAANVMHQVAEFDTAKWIVAEILDDSAALSVGMPPSDPTKGIALHTFHASQIIASDTGVACRCAEVLSVT